MKKVLLAMIAIALMGNVQAQEEGKFRVGTELGGAIPGGGFGLMWSLEAKYNLADNMNVGLRLSSGAFIKAIETDAGGEFESGSVSANVGYLGTFDYYFNDGGKFAPFVGAGLGIFNVASVGVTADDNPELVGTSVEAGTVFGGMARAGFEIGKFRMGLEYNFIPSSPLLTTAGTEIGSSQNSYLGIGIGFFVGGGRWGN